MADVTGCLQPLSGRQSYSTTLLVVSILFTMKKVIQLQLLPSEEQADLLEHTMRQFNKACDWLAGHAFDRRCANRYALQKLYYTQLRERFGLKAQQGVLACAAVGAAYARDKTKRVHFRPDAALPFDARLWRPLSMSEVSMSTLKGRIRVPFLMGTYQAQQWADLRIYAKLVRRKDGKWFLLVCVESTDEDVGDPGDFLGIDLGVEKIAVDSDGEMHTSESVEHVREKRMNLTQQLQSKADTKPNAKARKALRRKLKRVSGREANFRRHTNHCIAKHTVAKAKGTNRGIVLEDLKGIRDRIRFRKPQRARMSSWSFAQLRAFIAYKAQQAGVFLAVIDPRNSSRTCAECGHCDKGNRRAQAEFCCRRCGHSDHADVNAARNLRATALCKQAELLDASPCFQAAAG